MKMRHKKMARSMGRVPYRWDSPHKNAMLKWLRKFRSVR